MESTTALDTGSENQKKSWKHRLGQVVSVLFLVIAVAVIARFAHSLDWPAIWTSIKETPASNLLAALGFASLGYAVFASYDVLCRHYTPHHVPAWISWLIAYVAYAFNLNLGTLIGGMGFRYRMYSRVGLGAGQISRIVGFGLVTNWIGFLLLAGSVLVFVPPDLPASWSPGPAFLKTIGAGLLAVFGCYIVACLAFTGRPLSIGKFRFTPPSIQLAMVQVMLSCISWLMMALTIWTLMPHRVDLQQVIAALFVSSIAGIMMHIPGGLGVIETVFVTMLSGQASQPTILGAILTYRGVYFILPFVVAVFTYIGLEAKARRAAQQVREAREAAVKSKLAKRHVRQQQIERPSPA